MNILMHLSNIIIPAIIFYIVATGLAQKQDVYSDFIKGARDGFTTVIKIAPTLVGLMVAVGILRASGFLDFIGSLFARMTGGVGVPAPVVPVIIVKLFSSSAATGLVLDIFKEFGTDSYIGLVTSIMMGSTDIVVIYRRNEEYLQNTGFGVCPYFFPFAGWSESANYVKAMVNRMLMRLE